MIFLSLFPLLLPIIHPFLTFLCCDPKAILREEKRMERKRQNILEQEIKEEQKKISTEAAETKEAGDADGPSEAGEGFNRRVSSSFSQKVGRRSFSSFDADPSMLDGGGSSFERCSESILQAAASAAELHLNRASSGVDIASEARGNNNESIRANESKERNDLSQSSTTATTPAPTTAARREADAHTPRPYVPSTVAASRLFATGGIPPTELLARARALELPPLPMDLGVVGLGVVHSSGDATRNTPASKLFQSRSRRRGLRTLGSKKNFGKFRAGAKDADSILDYSTPPTAAPESATVTNYGDALSIPSLDPAFDLDTFDYGFPDYQIDGETNANKGDNNDGGVDMSINAVSLAPAEVPDSIGSAADDANGSMDGNVSNTNTSAALSAAMNTELGSNTSANRDSDTLDRTNLASASVRSLYWLRENNRNGLYEWKPCSLSPDEVFGRVVKQRRTWLDRDAPSGVILSSEVLGLDDTRQNDTNRQRQSLTGLSSDESLDSSARSTRSIKGAHAAVSAGMSGRRHEANSRIVRGNLGAQGTGSMVLVASLRDHVPGKAVTSMAVAEDCSFFVTASNDGTVKVWKSKGSGTMLEGGHHSVGSHSLAGPESSSASSLSPHRGAKANGFSTSAAGSSADSVPSRPTGTMCICENSQTVAVATTAGHIELLRVDRMQNIPSASSLSYRGVSSSQKANRCGVASARIFRDSHLHASEGSVVGVKHLLGPTSSTLVYATEGGVMRGLDLRMRRPAFVMRLRSQLGHVMCMSMSKGDNNGLGNGGGDNGFQSGEHRRYGGGGVWAAVGTHRGYMAVWDLRFMTLSKLWKHSSGKAVHKMMTVDNQLPRSGATYGESGAAGVGNDYSGDARDRGMGPGTDRGVGIGARDAEGISHLGPGSAGGGGGGSGGGHAGFQPMRKASLSSFDSYGKFRGHSDYGSMDDIGDRRGSQLRRGRDDRMGSSRDPLVLASAGTRTNEIALWNLDSGVCEHVFRVLPQVVSDYDALICPSLESIPLAVDPGGLSHQPRMGTDGGDWNSAFEAHSAYQSNVLLQGASPSTATFSQSTYRQFGQSFSQSTLPSARTADVPGIQAMLWTPDAMAGASKPHLITAGADTVSILGASCILLFSLWQQGWVSTWFFSSLHFARPH